MNACRADACDQGHKACPCPNVCCDDEAPISLEQAMEFGAPSWLVAVVAVVFAAVMASALFN